MRAVNLLPSDLRGAAPKAAPSARQEKVEGIGAYLVLGALALCVAAFAAFVLTTNTIKQRETDLQAAKDRGAAATARANALRPYADFEALASARVETVRGLAAARFDWEQAFRDLSRAVPSDVRLTSFNGDMGLPGSQTGGDALRGSIAAPAISLTGCAPSQVGVARMLARLKAVDGVTRVSLSKTEKPAATGAAAPTTGVATCPGKQPPTFSAVIFFEKSAALEAFSQGSEASAAAVPVPNAVNGAGTTNGTPAADATAAGDGATTPAPADSAGTSTTTSTTTGSTP